MLFETPNKLWDGPHCIMIPNVQIRKLRLGEVTRQGGGRTEVEPKPRDPRICVLSHYSILSMCLPQSSPKVRWYFHATLVPFSSMSGELYLLRGPQSSLSPALGQHLPLPVFPTRLSLLSSQGKAYFMLFDHGI